MHGKKKSGCGEGGRPSLSLGSLESRMDLCFDGSDRGTGSGPGHLQRNLQRNSMEIKLYLVWVSAQSQHQGLWKHRREPSKFGKSKKFPIRWTSQSETKWRSGEMNIYYKGLAMMKVMAHLGNCNSFNADHKPLKWVQLSSHVLMGNWDI